MPDGPFPTALLGACLRLKEKATMTKQNFPPGWDEDRVRDVLAHYENQTEDEQREKT
jgi:hypothetical protein